MAVPGVITKKECYAYISSTTIQTQLIFFNEAKEELIFPVNNMCLENRTVLSSCIRMYITGHKKAVIEKEVTIHCYVLESNVKEEGDKEGHAIV